MRAITAMGRKAAAFQLDVSNVATFKSFAEGLRETLRQTWQRDTFDYLVNNAGHGDMALIAETTEAQFDKLVGVHFKGVFFLTQALLPLIADGGRIVNLSSGLTRIAYPGFSAYSAPRVARAVAVIRAEFAKPLPVDQLAAIAGMSPSAFHHHFRNVTSMTPLQFQKRLRLLEARRLLLADGVTASSAAFAVGYQSVSQFTRDYRRMFGLPPVRETVTARQARVASVAPEESQIRQLAPNAHRNDTFTMRAIAVSAPPPYTF